MTWDGDGVDPWLPARLRHIEQVTEAEAEMYQEYWARLTSWLITVHRAVLRGVRPDANAVWSRAPEWAQAMASFVQGPVKHVFGLAFEGLFGEGYHFDSRPATQHHLAVVHNRMVRTSDEVFDLIAGEIGEGAGLGESIPDLAARVDRVLDTTETENWRNRATVVARTETLGALNAGRGDAFNAVSQELHDPHFEEMWLSTDDTRTRPSHVEADGQRVPLGQPFTVGGHSLARPGDPLGPASEVIQCRCTTLLLRPGENVDLSNRQFTDW